MYSVVVRDDLSFPYSLLLFTATGIGVTLFGGPKFVIAGRLYAAGTSPTTWGSIASPCRP
jgi:hypothetical protein